MYSLLVSIWALPLVCVVAMCIWTIVRTITRPKRWRGEPACERCGYIVVGLASLGCPECGSDLRRTGIITPAMEIRRRGSLASALLAWVVTGLLVGYFVTLLLSMFFGFSFFRVASRPTTMTTTQVFTPRSRSFTDAVVVLNRTSGGGVARSDLEITLTANDGQSSAVRANNSGNGWSYVSLVYPTYGTMQTGVPHSVEIRAVMESAGIDVDRQGAAEECNQLSIRILEIADESNALTGKSPSPMSAFNVGAQTFTSTSPGQRAGGLDTGEVTLIGGFLLWVGGAVFIIFRRRKMLNLARAYESEAALPPASCATSSTRGRPD